LLPVIFYFVNAFLCISKYPFCPAERLSSRCLCRAFSMGSKKLGMRSEELGIGKKAKVWRIE